MCDMPVTYVPAVPLVAGVAWHVEPVLVVGEVVSDLVVAWARHVWHSAGHGLDLLQELVSHFSLVPVQVVGEIPHVQNCVIETLGTDRDPGKNSRTLCEFGNPREKFDLDMNDFCVRRTTKW